MKDAVKEAGQLLHGKKGKEALELLPKVYKVVDKAVKRGIIKANAAARIKSRFSKRIRVLVG
jgi:ribosomal protein S20